MSGTPKIHKYKNLTTLAQRLRSDLNDFDCVLIYAYNGTGKTRLSMAFKDMAKRDGKPDTLYFNAFTEDLFSWDNDRERKLQLNTASSFFAGLASMEMDTRIRPLLNRYADFEFRIDITSGEVFFDREVRVKKDGTADEEYETHRQEAIKISRGEENIFIWCFFLAILQLALDDDGTGPYHWVKYVYIDDPISSLDEHNAIAVANHLAQMLKKSENRLKAVISTHHTLFFNVLYHELPEKKTNRYFLSRDGSPQGLLLRGTGDTPSFHHVAALVELRKAADEDRLYTHHFNMLRAILEKTASFHGYKKFSKCIERDADDEDGILHARLINVLSHGNYSLFEPREMLEEKQAALPKNPPRVHRTLSLQPRPLFPKA